MAEPAVAAEICRRFDHVLVDEYQDTNRLQAEILLALRPDGSGLTVVGDDAQSIYSFRAAAVRNILDFPGSVSPPAAVIALERNYRSTQPILDVANAVIAGAGERFAKTLYSTKESAELPYLVSAEDEAAQASYVADHVLEHREAGIALKRQAVLFRAAHHSDLLEIELGRRNIPFVKYGGLKFLEAAHVKDVLAILRWAENPRDAVAGHRALQLQPGIGPGTARNVIERLAQAGFVATALAQFTPPAAASVAWPGFCRMIERLRDVGTPWSGQLGLVREWYQPQLERLYDYAAARSGDLDQLEQIAAGYATRERFLTELTLDPPDASGAEAGRPQLDEDYLILSTIHSAKGQEWDAVFVLNLVDGCIPSDMATGRPEQIDEERRLLYVAMTRAREHLHLLQPLRFYLTHQPRHGRGHVMAPRSRFLPDEVLGLFTRRTATPHCAADAMPSRQAAPVDIGARLRNMWNCRPVWSLPQRATIPEHLALNEIRAMLPTCAILHSPLRRSHGYSARRMSLPQPINRADNRASGLAKAGAATNPNITDDMRSGPNQRPRGRFNANRPFRQQPRGPQNNQTFDSNGPNIKIRGNAHQIFERYIALAREATASGDRVAAENFYQHAEHYFRINNARREGISRECRPGRPRRPTSRGHIRGRDKRS